MCRIVEAETKVQRLNSLLTHVLACSHASLNFKLTDMQHADQC